MTKKDHLDSNQLLLSEEKRTNVYENGQGDLIYSVRNGERENKIIWPSDVSAKGFKQAIEGEEDPEEIKEIKTEEGYHREIIEELEIGESGSIVSRSKKESDELSNLKKISYLLETDHEENSKRDEKTYVWKSSEIGEFPPANTVSLTTPKDYQIELGSLERVYDLTALEGVNAIDYRGLIIPNLADILDRAGIDYD